MGKKVYYTSKKVAEAMEAALQSMQHDRPYEKAEFITAVAEPVGIKGLPLERVGYLVRAIDAEISGLGMDYVLSYDRGYQVNRVASNVERFSCFVVLRSKKEAAKVSISRECKRLNSALDRFSNKVGRFMDKDVWGLIISQASTHLVGTINVPHLKALITMAGNPILAQALDVGEPQVDEGSTQEQPKTKKAASK